MRFVKETHSIEVVTDGETRNKRWKRAQFSWLKKNGRVDSVDSKSSDKSQSVCEIAAAIHFGATFLEYIGRPWPFSPIGNQAHFGQYNLHPLDPLSRIGIEHKNLCGAGF